MRYVKPNKSKFYNKVTMWNGRRYASLLELERHKQLILLERAGKIKDLKFQEAFELFVDDIKIAKYIADFTYTDLEKGDYVVEDTKGVLTDVFKLKKKIFEINYRPQKITLTNKDQVYKRKNGGNRRCVNQYTC